MVRALFRAFVHVSILVGLSSISPAVRDSLAADPRSSVDAALGKVLRSGNGFPEFRAAFLDELQRDPAFFTQLTAVDGEKLEERLESLLVSEVRRAMASRTYPVRMLPGLRSFTGIPREPEYGDPLPKGTDEKFLKDADENLLKRIEEAFLRDPTSLNGEEVYDALVTKDETAKFVFAALRRNSKDSLALKEFMRLESEFAPFSPLSQTETVRAVMDHYPSEWTTHADQEHLGKFWFKFDQFCRFRDFRNGESSAEFRLRIRNLPARERVYLRALGIFSRNERYSSANDLITIRRAQEELYLSTAGWNGDNFQLLFSGQIFSLHPGTGDTDLLELISERAQLMKRGERGPIGAFLFEKLMMENPDLAKEIAPTYLQNDFWPMLLYPVDGEYPMRGTPAFIFTGDDPGKIREQMHATRMHVPYDELRVNRIARYMAESKNEDVLKARSRIQKELWKMDRRQRWILVKKDAFLRLFPENDPGRARVEFLTQVEAASRVITESSFNASASNYLEALLRRPGAFEVEFMDEPYLRFGLNFVDWGKVKPSVRSAMLRTLENLDLSQVLGAGDRVMVSFAFENLLKAHVQQDRPSAAEVKRLSRKAVQYFTRDLEALAVRSDESPADVLAKLFSRSPGDEKKLTLATANSVVKRFESFRMWVEVTAAGHGFSESPELQHEVGLFQRLLVSRFPEVTCSALLKDAKPVSLPSGDLFQINLN